LAKMAKKVWDVVIIGSGPAGLTAAIYASRGAASTLVLAGEQWGGQLMLTTQVDNFPGFSKGVDGPDLMLQMRRQAERFGAQVIESNLTSLDLKAQPFKLKTDSEYLSKSLIIATGASTRWLGVPGEEKLRGRGISSCAPCDAPFFKSKKVIVVGGGDSAMEEALVLTKYASSVTVIHRRDSFRASEAMQKKVLENPSISVIWNTEVVEFLGQDKLEQVVLKNIKTAQKTHIRADGAFIAIGHLPSTSVFEGRLELDEGKYVKRLPQDSFQMATSVPGVFVAGDVHDHRYRQAITAAAFGCMAAMEILQFLDKDMPSW
jgi:thioredoxin reductase (NADPH)